MFLLNFIALVATAPDKMMVYNFPKSDSCATWVEDRKTRSNQVLEGWVLGFVTGYNAFGSPDRGLSYQSNGSGLLAWMDNYCSSNPLDSVTIAAFKLTDELNKRSRARHLQGK